MNINTSSATKETAGGSDFIKRSPSGVTEPDALDERARAYSYVRFSTKR